MGNVTPIDVNVNHLAFCAIKNVMEACHVIIKDKGSLTLKFYR